MRPGAARQIVMALAFLVLSVRGADAWVLASLTGDWSASVGTLELTGAAGSDFAPTLESPVDVATLEIESTSDWRVDVSRAGASWPSTLSISVLASSVKTRGNGSATASPSYTSVGTTPMFFANGVFGGGRSIRALIGLQYLIEGISAEMGAGIHTATIVYTVTDQ